MTSTNGTGSNPDINIQSQQTQGWIPENTDVQSSTAPSDSKPTHIDASKTEGQVMQDIASKTLSPDAMRTEGKRDKIKGALLSAASHLKEVALKVGFPVYQKVREGQVNQSPDRVIEHKASDFISNNSRLKTLEGQLKEAKDNGYDTLKLREEISHAKSDVRAGRADLINKHGEKATAEIENLKVDDKKYSEASHMLKTTTNDEPETRTASDVFHSDSRGDYENQIKWLRQTEKAEILTLIKDHPETVQKEHTDRLNELVRDGAFGYSEFSRDFDYYKDKNQLHNMPFATGAEAAPAEEPGVEEREVEEAPAVEASEVDSASEAREEEIREGADGVAGKFNELKDLYVQLAKDKANGDETTTAKENIHTCMNELYAAAKELDKACGKDKDIFKEMSPNVDRHGKLTSAGKKILKELMNEGKTGAESAKEATKSESKESVQVQKNITTVLDWADRLVQHKEAMTRYFDKLSETRNVYSDEVQKAAKERDKAMSPGRFSSPDIIWKGNDAEKKDVYGFSDKLKQRLGGENVSEVEKQALIYAEAKIQGDSLKAETARQEISRLLARK